MSDLITSHPRATLVICHLGNLYYYDSAWRLCEERSATHWDGSAEFTAVKITQRIWCPLYIDALIATQTDTSGADPGPGADGDFTDAIFANTLYAACDRKYDVIAMTDADGILKERTGYSPYGVARHRPPADLNGDGKIDGVDQLILFNAWGASLGSGVYNPDADINFDGQVNGADFLILSNNFGADPAPPGAVSQHGNTVGYSGYLHDDAIGMSLARFRWYDAETGRWATRDPLGSVSPWPGIETITYDGVVGLDYISDYASLTLSTPSIIGRIDLRDFLYFDGMNLYEYISCQSLSGTDPFGLYQTYQQEPATCGSGVGLPGTGPVHDVPIWGINKRGYNACKNRCLALTNAAENDVLAAEAACNVVADIGNNRCISGCANADPRNIGCRARRHMCNTITFAAKKACGVAATSALIGIRITKNSCIGQCRKTFGRPFPSRQGLPTGWEPWDRWYPSDHNDFQ